MIDQINLLYEKILALSVTAYEDLAERTYEAQGGPGGITEAWILGILEDYDPVVKYVFTNELERKGARLAEGVIAAAEGLDKPTVNSVKKEFDKGLSYVTWQTDVFAITVEDAATVKAFRDSGVKKVRWRTEEDEDVCQICEKRNRVVYPIDGIPPKPHPNCRCWLQRL